MLRLFSVSRIALAKNAGENKDDVSGKKMLKYFSGKKTEKAAYWLLLCPWKFIARQRQEAVIRGGAEAGGSYNRGKRQFIRHL